MVSLHTTTRSTSERYLIVEINLIQFVVPLAQLDRIEEFDTEFQNGSELEFYLGDYRDQNENILVLNLKKYLRCPNEEFVRTVQSRILFLRYSEKTFNRFDTINIGVGVDAVIDMYHAVTCEKIKNAKTFATEDLQCFQISSSVKINSRIYPILDLIKVLDLT
ncbi:MAG: hypothetical protein ACFFC6_06845 [Promethearchaeota archaeon]